MSRSAPAISARKTTSRPKGPSSRYDGGSAYTPSQGLARPPASVHIRTAVAAVQDPDPFHPDLRIRVTVNRRVDLLEMERSHRRIREDEYQVGRVVQAVFERASGASRSTWNPGNRSDMVIAHELSIIHGIVDAATIGGYVRRIIRVIGEAGAHRLRRHLTGVGFTEEAEARGKARRAGAAAVAEQFRWDLKALSDAWAARGAMILVEDPRAARLAVKAGEEDVGDAFPKIRASRAVPTGEETDAAGVVVPAGHGYRWGRDEETD